MTFYLKKYKDFCILTSTDYSLEDFNIYTKAKRLKKIKESKKTNTEDKKTYNNIIRAKQKIYDYAIMNDFNYFYTQTISSKFDRSDYNSVFNYISHKFRNLRYSVPSLSYLMIVEEHKKKNTFHFHGLLKGEIETLLRTNDFGYLTLKPLENIGFNSISIIKDKEKCSAYITKYITKDLFNRKKGEHLYFHSNDLVLPEQKNFYGQMTFDWDFQNDYCKKKKLPLDFWENFS